MNEKFSFGVHSLDMVLIELFAMVTRTAHEICITIFEKTRGKNEHNEAKKSKETSENASMVVVQFYDIGNALSQN